MDLYYPQTQEDAISLNARGVVPKDVVQLGPVVKVEVEVEVEVVVEDVLQVVHVCPVAIKASSQSVLTTCKLFHGVQLTIVSVFLK